MFRLSPKARPDREGRPGILEFALKEGTPHYDFDIRKAAETPSAVYSFHKGYFILDDYEHTRRIIEDYARMEGLPVPTLVQYSPGKKPLKVWREAQRSLWRKWHAKHLAKSGQHIPPRNRKVAA